MMNKFDPQDNALVIWFTDEEMRDLLNAATEHGYDLRKHAKFVLLDDAAR